MTKIFDEVIHLDVNDSVGVITIDRPPVNAMNVAVRSGLLKALTFTAETTDITSVCLIGARGMFISGADIKEFDEGPLTPSSIELIEALERMKKPIVAAIAGVAFGGGLEIALACHYRVATTNAALGQLEINLGLIPGAGGTQRLPRVIGFAKATEMIFSGKPIGGKTAYQHGLVDAMCDDDLAKEASDFVRERAALPLPLVRNATKHIEYAQDHRDEINSQLDRWRAMARSPIAAEHAVTAINAAIDLSFDEGMRRERQLFVELRDGDESRAHRYVFFAERKAAKTYKKSPVSVQDLNVAVVGAGTMGIGISMALANSDIPTVLTDESSTNLNRAIKTIQKNYERMLAKNTISETEFKSRMALIKPSDRLTEASAADVIIECVFEDLTVKQNVFRQLDKLSPRGNIFASNTSALNIDDLARATSRPSDFLGLHFFSPANVMRLVEVVKGAETSEKTIQRAVELVRKLGKVAVVVGVCPGFVGNRMHLRRAFNVERLLQEGVLPTDIDRVAKDFGFAMGPCATSDLTGLDVAWRIRQSQGTSFPVADTLVAQGRLGQKTMAGYYRYAEGSRIPLDDPDVSQIIKTVSMQSGYKKRFISDQEILERLLLPIINEGAKILEEKIAETQRDIDVIWVNGYGWPAWRGGPMYYAQKQGLNNIYERLNHYAKLLSDKTLVPSEGINRLKES